MKKKCRVALAALCLQLSVALLCSLFGTAVALVVELTALEKALGVVAPKFAGDSEAPAALRQLVACKIEDCHRPGLG